jgi:hypothetical protein
LRTAPRETITRGNPIVKYDRSAPPVLCKYAGVKSWNTFARNASLWVMDDIDGTLRVQPYTRDNKGAFTVDKNATKTMPAASTVDDLIECMIAILEEAAQELRTRLAAEIGS